VPSCAVDADMDSGHDPMPCDPKTMSLQSGMPSLSVIRVSMIQPSQNAVLTSFHVGRDAAVGMR